ncbi:MAG: DUF692 family protein [Myxococcales bacterium FL481]|nr:MAG: DUF692 family protein [Myxococcales bacterium FL481]
MLEPASLSTGTGPTGMGLGLRWEFIDEVDAGWTTPSLRFFEVSPENYMRRGGCFPAALARIAEKHRLLTHGLMLDIGGADPLDGDYLKRLRRFLARFGATRHTDHLCWTRRHGRYLHDLLPLRCSGATARYVAERVARVQDALGVPLALENISYYGAAIDGLSERDFLCEVLERADCSLLLDVNNVHVNGQNHGFDPIDYLSGLPLQRVVQLHVAGGERRPQLHDMLIDTHGADVSAEVRELLGWVVERVGPLPVLYERDHDIPPVDQLAAQIEQLDGVYRRALERHEARRSLETPVVVPSVDDARSGLELSSGYQAGVAHVVLGARDVTGNDEVLVAALRRQPDLLPDDREVVVRVGSPALYVYRRLVRGTIVSVVETFLSRTRARFEGELSPWVDRWLAHCGATTAYLADAPLEFLDWAEPRWRADPNIAAYLPDLARHELTEFEVGMLPDPDPLVGDGEPFALTSTLVVTPTLRLRSYAYAVHELPQDEDDRTVPVGRDTLLLCYRDADHEVRYLALSPVAMAWVRHLRDGMTVESALRSACREAGEALGDEILARMSQLLADLAQRGVVLGVR